ncbi:hypothetical protein BDV37DRAFT_291593 [Aspergillus pseudonomiae]|uniref:C2H2 type zinc finger domain protein n=1 Tax=Aspergillus pseudonomiae TaxID=1506151 RepID=A0A5N7DKR7_9EURO|nr:uncharacterized protein BDV37DRAFT_291593 [Aspergillus pseudonomiae]KAE8406895.1 hypothetical protein BDV37DRAFT_291593 [Aspergillus pseudonomiae]
MDPTGKFGCEFPGCNASYARKGHLNRHKVQHAPQRSFRCLVCGQGFRRKDILRRHMRQRHEGSDLAPSIKQACVNCRHLKSRCEGGPPCTGCIRRRMHCSFNDGPRYRLRQALEPGSSGKIQHFLKLYFETFHPHWPFIHQGSFNQSKETTLLVQSMVVIGMWSSGVQSNRSAAIELHAILNSAIYEQREKWDASISKDASSNCSWPIPMYQAILLHVIFSLIGKGNVDLGLDLKPSLPATDLDLLSSLVLSCRALGMFYYPNMLARYHPDDLADYVLVGVEEVKRFDIALFRVCKSIGSDRGETHLEHRDTSRARWQVTASELQFPMPKNELMWNAITENEWKAAATEGMECINLSDSMESQWISNSSELLQLT